MPKEESINFIKSFAGLIKIRNTKKNLCLILCLVFCILTFAGAISVRTGKADNAGYALIPWLLDLILLRLYQNSRKTIEAHAYPAEK